MLVYWSVYRYWWVKIHVLSFCYHISRRSHSWDWIFVAEKKWPPVLDDDQVAPWTKISWSIGLLSSQKIETNGGAMDPLTPWQLKSSIASSKKEVITTGSLLQTTQWTDPASVTFKTWRSPHEYGVFFQSRTNMESTIPELMAKSWRFGSDGFPFQLWF